MAQSQTLKDWLLYTYVKNHFYGGANRALGIVLIMACYYMFYGMPSYQKVLFIYPAIFISATSYVLQKDLYAKILKNGWATRKQFVALCLNKIFYTFVFLSAIFYPFHTSYLYAHLVGYTTALTLILFSMTLSSACMPLFYLDVGINAAFIVLMAYTNLDIQETYYVLPLLGATLLLSTITARIMNRETKSQLYRRHELAQAVVSANAAKEAKALFLATMSHEIRTPLNGIMGMIHNLHTQDMNPEQRQSISIIESCSQTLMNTLNDILDLSKIEAGKFNINPTNFDLYEALGNIQALMAARAKEKNLPLLLEIATDVPRYIYADANRLNQIILNLVGNAVKFTDKGRITIRARVMPHNTPVLHIEVEDTGIGISADAQKKLFGDYVQAEVGTAAKYGGTGLGLSIARQLAILMDGRLGVNSLQGKGSIFRLDIPCIEASAPVAAKMPAAQKPAEPLLMTGAKKILAAEDNPVNRKVLDAMLHNSGLTVEYAHDGAQAVLMAGETRYDLILMDMDMPVMDGPTATRAIRVLNEHYRKIPIIALTGYDDQTKLDEAMAAGMTDHILKPIESAILNGKIMSYLQEASVIPFRMRGR